MSKPSTRMTKQKKLIMEILDSTTSHPTADWVYEQARQEMSDISLGTVYRNLKVLVESGEVMELNYGSTFRRFDGNAHDHYHFVCEECGEVLDVELPVLEQLNSQAQLAGIGKVKRHRLEFYGICKKCTPMN